jgi:type IV secretory pathway VirB3-like protein
VELVETIEIPSGLVTARTFAGVPLEAGLIIVATVGVPWIMWHSVWTLILAAPVWTFMKYHTRHDPLFLKLWAGHLSFRPYYHG